MNHWQSRGSDLDGQQRVVAASTLRTRLNQLLQADPRADVLAMGDFNDYPSDPSVKIHLNTTDDEAQATGQRFFNTTAALAAAPNRGTYVFNNKWETIDQIMVSPGLLNPAGFRWTAGSSTEIRFPEQIYTPSNPQNIPRPNRSYTGNDFHANGISDHLPVACRLEY